MRKNESVGKGQTLRTESSVDRQAKVPNKNKAMPSGFGGGVNNLEHTLRGNRPSAGKSGKNED